jgi:hypothetical protein
MAQVFMSYKRENLKTVQPLVRALRARAVEVWWDQDIAPDAPWEATIEREHALAKVVIVAWSKAAVASENVKAEARLARSQGKLIQVFVEACELPMFFGERQGLNLVGWKGSARDRRFVALFAAVEALVAGKHPPEGVGYAPRRRNVWAGVGAAVGAASVTLGFVSNLGGTRTTLCGLGPLEATCRVVGLAPAPPADPAALAKQARSTLISSVDGAWGRADGDCSTPLTVTTATGTDGVARIKVTQGVSFNSEGQIMAADDGVIVSRDVDAQPGAPRREWEYRPKGDELTVVDDKGVATHLLRCAPRKS